MNTKIGKSLANGLLWLSIKWFMDYIHSGNEKVRKLHSEHKNRENS